MKLGRFEKQRAEREAYAIEYEDDLASGDTIALGPVVLVEIQGGMVDSTLLMISPVAVTATRVTLWVSGGTNGATYKITVTASTLSGRVLQDEVTLKIKDI